MQAINIYPVLKTWKPSKDGSCAIAIAVDINNKRATLSSTGRRVLPDQWDGDKRQVRKGVPNADITNVFIRKRVADLEADLTRKELLGQNVSKDTVRSRARGKDNGADFYAFCLEQIRVSNYTAGTRRLALAEVSKVKQYQAAATFSEITPVFLQGYELWMRDRGNQDNTIWKSMKFLTTIVNRAIRIGGYFEKSPFLQYDKPNYKQGIPSYLEWPEVAKIREVLSSGALAMTVKRVGYYFLLSCYSGLRFSDAIQFSDRFITEDETGRRILLNTAKTGEIVSIAFTKDIEFVVQWLKANPLRISNQRYNDALKILGPAAGLSKPLHSHMARHTFAMRCAELGMREEDVQRLLGHSSREHTKIYFRVKNKRLDEAMSVWDKP